MAFLATFRCVLLCIGIVMWAMMALACIAAANSSASGGSQLGSWLFFCFMGPLFLVCAVTGFCLMAAAGQLLGRLRRLRRVLRRLDAANLTEGISAYSSFVMEAVTGLLAGSLAGGLSDSLRRGNLRPRLSTESTAAPWPSFPSVALSHTGSGHSITTGASEGSDRCTMVMTSSPRPGLTQEDKCSGRFNPVEEEPPFSARGSPAADLPSGEPEEAAEEETAEEAPKRGRARSTTRSVESGAGTSGRLSELSLDMYTRPSPDVEPVLSSVRRILAVVAVCMAAFLFRAGCLLYLCWRQEEYWPSGMVLPYYVFSEVIPAALLLLLYLLPGLEAACFILQARRHGVAGRSWRPSVLESELSPARSGLAASFCRNEGQQQVSR
ncbi:unnamed protein product [Polarella glacialis]|uniref:Transmembrane protein n=1 Tax=Polarella glacialis TaxID=89957 RepID=A0A813GPC1_POLGL|nr:unnamed protein product [Polarella glacialis]